MIMTSEIRNRLPELENLTFKNNKKNHAGLDRDKDIFRNIVKFLTNL